LVGDKDNKSKNMALVDNFANFAEIISKFATKIISYNNQNIYCYTTLPNWNFLESAHFIFRFQ